MLSFLLFILRLNYKPKLHHWRAKKPPPTGSLAFCPGASMAAPMPRDVEVGMGQLNIGNSRERQVGSEGAPSGSPWAALARSTATRVWLRFSNMCSEGRWLDGPSQLCDQRASPMWPRCPTRPLTVLLCTVLSHTVPMSQAAASHCHTNCPLLPHTVPRCPLAVLPTLRPAGLVVTVGPAEGQTRPY